MRTPRSSRPVKCSPAASKVSMKSGLTSYRWRWRSVTARFPAYSSDASDGFEPDFHAGAHAHEEPIDPTKRAEMVDKLKKIIESVDANGDGRLSMDEIKGHVSKGVRGQMEADNKR